MGLTLALLMRLEKEPSERKIRTGIAMQPHKGIISKTTFMEEKKKKQEHFKNAAVRDLSLALDFQKG